MGNAVFTLSDAPLGFIKRRNPEDILRKRLRELTRAVEKYLENENTTTRNEVIFEMLQAQAAMENSK